MAASFALRLSLLDERDGGGDVSDTGVAAELGCFGIATAEQAGVDDASAVVPEVELSECLREAAGVDVAKQGGVQEVGDADVVGEVNEGIELGLRELDGDGVVYAMGGGADIAEEERNGLLLSDGLAGVNTGSMAVADGPDSVLVLVGGEDIAFEELGQSKPVFAVAEVVDAHWRNFPRRPGVAEQDNEIGWLVRRYFGVDNAEGWSGDLPEFR